MKPYRNGSGTKPRALYLELYERLIATESNADCEIAIATFSWLLCAQRTLESAEFLTVLSNFPRRQFSHEATQGHVLGLCSNMIIYDQTLDVFRFARLSVRKFLEKRPEYSTAATNGLVAETTLFVVLGTADSVTTRRFLANISSDLPKSLCSSELSLYSITYWASHCQLAAAKRTDGLLKKLLYHFRPSKSGTRSAIVAWATRVEQYLNDDVRFFSTDEMRNKLQETEAVEGKALFIASCFDFQELTSIRAHFHDEIKNKNNKKAVKVAMEYGSIGFISEIMKDKEMRIEDLDITAAAQNWINGIEVMELMLVKRGADEVITEGVFKVAASNKSIEEDIVGL